ncbi:MAG: GIY-YIG nuclease family protein [Patescibacteria group bacterium]
MKIDFKTIPAQPGVYFFKNKNKKVIYVGKATSLRSRLRQYFQDNRDPKTELMMAQAVDFSFSQTPSELLASILEAKLIKQYRPKYNLLLKDDKRHLYLGITNDQYPRIKPVRRPELENLLFWAGPFPSSLALKQLLRWTRKIFPYCSCKGKRKNNCLYSQIKLCPGQKVSPAQYRRTINKIVLFFSGESDKLLEKLTKEMTQSAKKLDFEKANQIKAQINHLERLIFSRQLAGQNLDTVRALRQLKTILIKHQNLDPFYLQRIECYDIANLGSREIVGAMAVLINGEPTSGEYRRFKIKRARQDDPACLAEVVSRRLNHQEWLYPQLILIDGGRPQLRAIIPILRERQLLRETGIIGLSKQGEVLVIPQLTGNKISFIDLKLPIDTPALKLLQTVRDEAHRFAQNLLHQRQKLKPRSDHFKK